MRCSRDSAANWCESEQPRANQEGAPPHWAWAEVVAMGGAHLGKAQGTELQAARHAHADQAARSLICGVGGWVGAAGAPYDAARAVCALAIASAAAISTAAGAGAGAVCVCPVGAATSATATLRGKFAGCDSV